MTVYRPYVTDVVMSQYGYWVVTVSVAPWLRMPVMVARLGLTREEARELVAASYASSGAPHKEPS